MDIHTFEHFLAAQKKISSITRQAYVQDLHEFFVLLGQKNKLLAQVSPADIRDYIDDIFAQTISYAYGVRKIAALKSLCKYIQEITGTLLLPEVTQLKIARFPVFCSEDHLGSVLSNYTHVNTYSDARSKLLIILLHRYNLSINQITHALTDITLQNKRSAHIRFSDTTSPLELLPHDHALLSHYCNLGQSHGLFSTAQSYLFPVKLGGELKPISSPALWSLVKKLCTSIRQNSDTPITVAIDHNEQATQRAIYHQKHPRP